jgi:hypothetical protein
VSSFFCEVATPMLGKRHVPVTPQERARHSAFVLDSGARGFDRLPSELTHLRENHAEAFDQAVRHG